MLDKFILILCISAVFAGIASEGEYQARWPGRELPETTHTLKFYEINLDLPLEQRWKQVMHDYKKPMEDLLSHLWIKNMPIGVFDYLSYPIAKHYQPEMAEEIKAYADLLDVSFTKLFMLNFMYDFAAMACSSIVMEDSEGNIILARTLDFGITEYAAALAFHAKYYKDGKLLYESADIAGYVGLLTGMKPDTYAFSINEYFLTTPLSVFKRVKLLATYLMQFFRGKTSPPYIARKAFEKTQDYEGLVKFLVETETISNVHYTVAGAKKGQGAVITKSQENLQNITSLDSDNGQWYLVQTNYVRNEPDPSWDNRKTAAIDRINALGRDAINKESLFQVVMNNYPNFNSHTIYTTVMQANAHYFNNTLWF